MKLFELDQISLSYSGEQFALDKLHLNIAKGEFVGILGPNGAGKSSLLRVLAGTRSPSAGTLLLEGSPLERLSPRQRAQQIAFVPQWSVIAFPFTVFELVLMGRHPHLGRLALESGRDVEIATEALRQTDSLRFQDRSFGTLSGGEMQRVMVARAIAQGSPTLLLDEPSSALDIQHQQRIYSILQELNRGGSTIIVTTHDLNLAAQYCKRLLLLHQGRIVADGSPEQALTQDMVERVYGTQVELLHRNGRITVLPKTPTGANP